MLQEATPHHAGLPEVEGYEQLMWAICQHLKADKDIRGGNESTIALPVGTITARGKNYRGTQPYFIGKSHACQARIVVVANVLSSGRQEEKA